MIRLGEGFEDFRLHAEAKINDHGNSGIYFRCGFGLPVLRSFPAGYEAQVLNGTYFYSPGKVEEQRRWRNSVGLRTEHVQYWVSFAFSPATNTHTLLVSLDTPAAQLPPVAPTEVVLTLGQRDFVLPQWVTRAQSSSGAAIASSRPRSSRIRLSATRSISSIWCEQ